MLNAISRQRARAHPAAASLVAACREKDEFIEGRQISAFEETFAARLGARHATATCYGRMAFHALLGALELPPGSEIVMPALTSWTMPAIARAAGLSVRFADVDPETFGMSAASLRAALTAKTRAVVPTHLYGLPCDLDGILEVAARHNLAVVEDCAHALGATYGGRPVGTFGDGAIFSFDTFAPLGCFGGGMAVARDEPVAARVRQQVEALPWPHEKRVSNRLLVGRLQRAAHEPRVFTVTTFPAMLALGLVGARPDIGFRERPRRLDPIPDDHLERFSNVQAVLGLAALDLLDGWTAAARSHARIVAAALADIPGVHLPGEPAGRTHVYHRYSVIVPKPRETVRRCLRRGVDLDMRHADYCPRLDPTPAARTAPMPGAELALRAVHVPVYAALSDQEARHVAKVVRDALARPQPDAQGGASVPTGSTPTTTS